VDNLPDWMQADIWRPLPGRNKDRSTFDWQIAKECARAGLKMADYIALYRLGAQEEFASKWREKEMNRPGSGDEYLARTYAKAKIAAEKEGPLPEKPDVEPVWQDDAPAEEGPPVEAPPSAQADWSEFVLTAEDVPDEEEEVPYLIFPWLQREAIHCVHGPTGGGKSYFTAHQLYGLALGKAVGPFDVPMGPKKVLYIDGEMGKRTLRKRLRDLKRSYGADARRNFVIWSPYFAPKGTDLDVNIIDPEQQQRFAIMARNFGADVIVFDNVRTCARGMIENDADSWEKLNEYWRKLRQLGLTVVWVHHNKKPQQAGGSDPEGSYSGSTNAMTVVEVQVPVLPVAVSKVEEWSEGRRRASGGARSITHGIVVDLAHAKNREKDLSIHSKMTLVYERNEETGAVQLKGFDEKRPEDTKVNLSKPQWVWAYWSGVATGGVPMPKKDIARTLKIPEGSIHYYAKSVEGNPAAQQAVREAFGAG
jgi:hypothetical protein